jgi:hypothetical protein
VVALAINLAQDFVGSAKSAGVSERLQTSYEFYVEAG